MDGIRDVISGKRPAWCSGTPSSTRDKCILPGSFNPLHDGHRQMASIAATQTGSPVEFELSVTNVDKPDLDYAEVAKRLPQFKRHCLWVTRATTFAEKAELFPGCRFIVGADTAVRLFSPGYYGGPEALEHAISHISTLNCRFLVFGRLMGDQFVDAGSISIPEHISELFETIPASSFRLDISSSEIRKRQLE